MKIISSASSASLVSDWPARKNLEGEARVGSGVKVGYVSDDKIAWKCGKWG